MRSITKTKLINTRKNLVYKILGVGLTVIISILAGHYGSIYLAGIDPTLEKIYTFSLIFFPLQFVLLHVALVALKSFFPD